MTGVEEARDRFFNCCYKYVPMIADLFAEMITVFINKHFQRRARVMETSLCRVFDSVTKFAFFLVDVKKHFTSW